MSCPKCDTPRREGATACPRCGLAVERWEGFAVSTPSHPPVDEAWARLEASWDDEGAHKRFLDRAAEVDGLDVAAARYRAVLRARPDDATARRGLERVVVLAEALHATRLGAARSRPPSPLWRWLGIALAGAMVLMSVLLARFVLLQHRP